MITFDPKKHSIQPHGEWETVSIVVRDHKFNNAGPFDPEDWQPLSEIDPSWHVLASMARGESGPLTIDIILTRKRL
jgi:hypothetical protein